MPLVPVHVPASTQRAPWRGAVAGAAAALVFIVGLAIVARATRNGALAPPRHPIVEEVVEDVAADSGTLASGAPAPDGGAGPLDGALHAGARDADVLVVAGAVEGPIDEPPAVPVVVAGPPVVAADVVAVAVPAVEECLKKALRFDPGLGGRVRLLVVVAAGRLALSLPSAPSPVLANCVASSGASLAWPTTQGERHVVEGGLALDGLRGMVRVESAELHAPE
jgi:hypothetical protein